MKCKRHCSGARARRWASRRAPAKRWRPPRRQMAACARVQLCSGRGPLASRGGVDRAQSARDFGTTRARTLLTSSTRCGTPSSSGGSRTALSLMMSVWDGGREVAFAKSKTRVTTSNPHKTLAWRPFFAARGPFCPRHTPLHCPAWLTPHPPPSSCTPSSCCPWWTTGAAPRATRASASSACCWGRGWGRGPRRGWM